MNELDRIIELSNQIKLGTQTLEKGMKYRSRKYDSKPPKPPKVGNYYKDFGTTRGVELRIRKRYIAALAMLCFGFLLMVPRINPTRGTDLGTFLPATHSSELALNSLPSDLPRGVVADRTLQWYDMEKKVSAETDVDPRIGLIFTDIESSGNKNAISKNLITRAPIAYGLKQFVPATWENTRRYILNSPSRMQQAKNLGIDVTNASSMDPLAATFFSHVFAVEFCELPTGNIPPKNSFGYLSFKSAAMEAGREYNQGENSDGAACVPESCDWMRKIATRLDGFAQ